jgi:hypothetical protein
MTLTVWQSEVRKRTESVMNGRRAQPLALLNISVVSNPEPWQALCSHAIGYAVACAEQLRRGTGEISEISHCRFNRMIRWIDEHIDGWRGEAVEQYRELRRLLAEIDPEQFPARDEMDRDHANQHLDPTFAIA